MNERRFVQLVTGAATAGALPFSSGRADENAVALGAYPISERIRFTQSKKGDVVSAFVMGWPAGDAAIKSLGTGAATNPGKVTAVEMLGGLGKLTWSQTGDPLVVQKPAPPPCDYALGFKVRISQVKLPIPISPNV